ncbi:DNA-processing protein DprA [Luteirhabdus pelagi]|uniref:DNA-processing protein DprA n=1 Tax=Luteirhabdus pelagi TaxID=2792783 RepID=UPI00193A8A52|nr:DNA-processing protein DprA [Luteirhabdus pelagi]
MLSEQELLYTLALQRIPNLGDISAKKLLRHFGTAEGIFKAKKRELLKIDGIGSLKLKSLFNAQYLDEAEAELHFIQKEKLQFSYYQDSSYPEHLKHCLDGPILFFHKGNIDIKNKKLLSIVGTRKATSAGIDFTKKLIEALAPLDIVIVSGFAYGIDITAHKAAIDHNLQTIACLAHGMNQIYPKSHKKYVQKMVEHGGFITEFWSDDTFDRNNFLRRNRIIAGISQATVVIESAEKGGSLVTADIAHSYNRDVFAVPGRTTDSQSVGCNTLIKIQKAQLITSAADILFHLGWEAKKPSPTNQISLFVELTEQEQKVYDFLKEKGKEEIDTISLSCDLPTFVLAPLLLSLELKGVVRPLPGKQFETL